MRLIRGRFLVRHWLKSPWRLYHLHRLVPQRLAGGSKEQPPVTTPEGRSMVLNATGLMRRPCTLAC